MILSACTRAFQSKSNRANCSGFVKAVAAGVGLTVGLTGAGQANDIYEEIQSPPGLHFGTGHVGADQAAYAARMGFFVIAAWKNVHGKGHVAIVTDLVALAGNMVDVSDRNVAAAWGVLNREDLAKDGGLLRETLNPTTRIPRTIYAGQHIARFS